MVRILTCLYSLISIALLATTIITARRAKAITGDDHYMMTITRIQFDRYVPPRNATDAALDEAFAEDDEESDATSAIDKPGIMRVEEPLFVLGLDVTFTFILLGGFVLWFVAAMSRNCQKVRHPANAPPPEASA